MRPRHLGSKSISRLHVGLLAKTKGYEALSGILLSLSQTPINNQGVYSVFNHFHYRCSHFPLGKKHNVLNHAHGGETSSFFRRFPASPVPARGNQSISLGFHRLDHRNAKDQVPPARGAAPMRFARVQAMWLHVPCK